MTENKNRPLRVFLCHAREDKPTVRELYRQLCSEGWLDVWLDEEKLLPGQEWDIEIEKAVEQADVVVVCLSGRSVDKEGYVQKELRFVLNIADEKPEGTIFVIPLKLEECTVPRRLRAWQWVEYFPRDNRSQAYQRLMESLKQRATRLGIMAVKPEDKRAHLEAEDPSGKGEDEVRKGEKTKEIIEVKHAGKPAGKPPSEKVVSPSEKKPAGRINFRRYGLIGIIILVLIGGIFGIKSLIQNRPATDTPTPTDITPVVPTSTFTPTRKPIPETPTSTVTPLTPVIGSTQVSEMDGMIMVYVPAGEFKMGSNSGDSDEQPVHAVYLDAFWMDQTEVTNKMYALCDAAGKCDSPNSSESNTRQNYYGNLEYDDFPVIYVSWNDASAYCTWAGRRLPTEAEWEKAAGWDADRQEKRTYPWGDSINCTRANYWGKSNGCIGDTTEVRNHTSGASFYGALDMAGNVWEWVADWYGETYYGQSPQSNPTGPTSGWSRVVRGGSWDYVDSHSRVTARGRNNPASWFANVGFRCAGSP